MEFKLNEYRQGVTDAELLADVLRVAKLHGDVYLSFSTYKSHGEYSEGTFRKRFGSWLNVLAKLGMRTERRSTEMQRISGDEMILDLKGVAERIGRTVVSSTAYAQQGRFSLPTIVERFQSWSNFIEKAGLEPTGQVRNVPDAVLFAEIERIWILLGKQPTTTDMKKGISRYSLDTFMRRFGGWRNALRAFIEYVNADGSNEDKEAAVAVPNASTHQVADINARVLRSKISTKRTSRNINLKLRFTVLQKDDFRCRSCGASPAKNPGIELHVDHIVPWSKGGETEIMNLQTLCSKCNLGKSNHEFS